MKTAGVPEPVARLRCAVLCRHFLAAGGGAERYAVAIVHELAATHEIHVFAQRFSTPIEGVVYYPIPKLWLRSGWLNQLWFAGFAWLRTRRGFDVVHSHENVWHGNVQTLHVKTVRGNVLPTVASGSARILQRLKLLSSPRMAAYLLLERARFGGGAALHVVVASQQLAVDMAQTYPQVRAQMSVISPGVNPPDSALDKARARALLGLTDAPTILFVANDFARKGLDALLHTLALLPAEVRLAVVGKPNQTSVYERRAHEIGVRDRVNFIGSLQDMSLAYRAADVLAHPTLEDSYAMVVLEALAHQLPVVVSAADYCGIAAELADQVNALVLPDPRDAQALFRALSLALFDEGTITRLVTYGTEFAQARSWRTAAARYEQIYALAAARGRNAGRGADNPNAK